MTEILDIPSPFMDKRAVSLPALCAMIGTPWVWQMSGLDGADCFGRLRAAYKTVGVEIPDITGDYSLTASAPQLHRAQMTSRLISRELPGWTQIKSPVFGAMIVVRLGGHPVHVGFYIDGPDGGILHACEDMGRTLIEPLTRYHGEGFSKIHGYYLPSHALADSDIINEA